MRNQKHFDLIVVPLSAINQWKRSPCFSFFFRTKQFFPPSFGAHSSYDRWRGVIVNRHLYILENSHLSHTPKLYRDIKVSEYVMTSRSYSWMAWIIKVQIVFIIQPIIKLFGSFNNYVDRILTFFEPPPPSPCPHS